jgi:Fe-S-cluster containining protein
MVTVTPKESDRLNNYWDITLDASEKDITINRVLPRSLETGHCTFLNGSLGVKIDCEIYEDRPQTCRDFEAGSDKCHAYRRMYGIEGPLTEAEVAAASARFEVKPPQERISFVGIVKDADYSIHDMEGELISTGIKLRIVAFLDEDGKTEHDLHIYDPETEMWFENEFLTLSLDEARELIASRTIKDS